jgi:hypothetical protein
MTIRTTFKPHIGGATEKRGQPDRLKVKIQG